MSERAFDSLFLRACESFADKTLFTVVTGTDHSTALTAAELGRRVRIVGSRIQAVAAAQERAILLFPQGLDYIVGLLSCFHANVIAVPTVILDASQRTQFEEKLLPVIRDARPSCILTTSQFKDSLGELRIGDDIRVLTVDDPVDASADLRSPSPCTQDDIALLLYTSGSTSLPKGVALTHAQLLAQSLAGAAQWGIDPESRIVSWMPQFHNFGLHFGILSPLLKGASSLLLPPTRFAKNPEEWLRTIDAFQATHTAAPNFAFDVCCSLVNVEDQPTLSLRSLRAIICGGEPIRKETYEAFVRKFQRAGLDPGVFCSHYGLSETGAVTTRKPGTRLRFLPLDINGLQSGNIQVARRGPQRKFIVDCGEPLPGIEVRIVDPKTCKPCAAMEIGEIWVRCSSAASSYWNRREISEQTFAATLADTREGPFLRTGDIGFLRKNRLYVSGRQKELIIVRGKNYYPIDIEWSIKRHIPELTLPTVVFSVERDNQERVVVVQEIESPLETLEYQNLTTEILAAVSQTHTLDLYEVNFIQKGTIPRTASGKLQRAACQRAYVSQSVPILYQYRRSTPPPVIVSASSPGTSDAKVLQTLKQRVLRAELGAMPIEEVSTFAELGLNSIQYARIAKRIEDVFRIPFEPAMLFKYRRLDQLADYLAEKTRDAAGSPSVGDSTGVVESVPVPPEEDIAVIGMSCHFPGGARNPESFWNNLIDDKNGIVSVEQARPELLRDMRRYGTSADSLPLWGGFIEDVDAFDASFFGISRLEANSMDPQQRKLLELTWAVFEDAGYAPTRFATERVGLFVGVHGNDYAELLARHPELMDVYGAYLDSGSHMSLIANRVSRWFDFVGPSEVVNTACSSSLVAIHRAVDSIARGESRIAIAAGINLILGARVYVASHRAGMLAADGRCKTFDSDANGFVRSEGYGALLLKSYRDAIRDGDTIYGVIKSAVVNHDGQSNSLRAPNMNAQKRLIQAAYRQSKLPLDTVTYLEAHGTGTSLGDPIEVQALKEAFLEMAPGLPTKFCGLGTVKTHIGHCESAAGIAGVIKVLLAMRHGRLPGLLHFRRLSPHISLKDSPFYLIDRAQAWPRLKAKDGTDIPRRAGVSSFGFGGVNAHVVVEEHIQTKVSWNVAPTLPAMIVLSARSDARLKDQARNLATVLQTNRFADSDLSDIAYTLQVGRHAMENRLAFTANTVAEARQKLERYLRDEENIENFYRGEGGRRSGGLLPMAQELEVSEAVAASIRAGRYGELLARWSAGLYVDWSALYGSAKRRRVSLPTYPFTKDRYWIEVASDEVKASVSRADNTKSGEVDDAKATGETVLLVPSWRAASIRPESADIRRVVLLDSLYRSQLAILRGNDAATYELLPEADGVETRLTAYGVAVLEQAQAILRSRPTGPVLLQVALGQEDGDIGQQGLLMAISGFLKSVRQENPRFIGQVIHVPAKSSADVLRAHLRESAAVAEDGEIRCVGGERLFATLRELPVEEETSDSKWPALPWKKGGVYLITGGAGGIGRLLAREIVERVTGARVVLTGRSPSSRIVRADLDALARNGGSVEYRVLDITDAAAVHVGIDEIRARFGGLNGVVHCAGVLNDGFLLKKTSDELVATLAPKVGGVVHLDYATAATRLDFMMLFSSIASVLGNAGQTDYALANGFLDRYAAYRNHLVRQGHRHGRTLAINWPLWEDGGMRPDVVTCEELTRKGFRALTPAAGFVALYRAWRSGESQVVVLRGERSKILEAVAPMPIVHSIARKDVVIDAALLGERVLVRLKTLFAAASGLRAEEIDVDEPLESYGIDSIMIARLNQELERVFDGLSKTLFFEYPTLRELRDFLVADSPVPCARWCELSVEQVPATSHSPATGRAAERRIRDAESNIAAQDSIAIIGISGRYPKAETIEQYWENLRAGKDCVSEIPAERWPLDGFYQADMEEAIAQGRSYSKWGGFIEGFADFDPLFFGISPREAMSIDPQERLFLQACWEVIEGAGYTRETLARRHGNRVGVFAGVTKTGFDLYGPPLWREGKRLFPRTSFSSIANRVSYLLNLSGPSMPIDTMCSASLTAVHEACEHIRRGECEMAIAGGVNLYLHPSNYVDLCAQRMLSVDGRCKSFGADGNGFVPGEGVGAVLLKPLSRAEADGDPIYAVIRATSVNHGGKTNGYTVPNPNAQRELIRAALRKADVNARAITYIEAHGTGTKLGDPIEVAGLTQAFATDTAESGFCAIGSVKSNIGHLEAAAGIAGLTKIVLQLKHGTLVPTLHAQELNPNIDFAKTPFVPQRQVAEWKRPVLAVDGKDREYPRIAGISSFGAGGSNAHVVIEEYAVPAERTTAFMPDGPAIWVLSARNDERLKAYAARLLYALDARGFTDADVADIAYTLQVGREAMDSRLAFSAETLIEAKEALKRFLNGEDGAQTLHRGDIRSSKGALASLAGDDEDTARLVTSWFAKRKYDKLMDLWVKGLSLDWHLLYGEVAPRRVALPTYPFAKERYWIGAVEEAAAPCAENLGNFCPNVAASPNDVPSVIEHLAGIKPVVPVLYDRSVQELQDQLDRLLGKRLCAELQALGLFSMPEGSLASWKAKRGIPSSHDHWLDEGLRVLETRGYLTRTGVDSVRVAGEPLDVDAVRAEWERAKTVWLGEPEMGPNVRVVDAMLQSLAEVLTGKRLATDILFPDSSMELMEGIYKNNRAADYFNEVLADMLIAAIEARRKEDPTVRVKILEIGAGTGGTTVTVLKKLAPYRDHIAEYCYTDISQAFLKHAEKTFGPSHAYLTYRLFDVERHPVEQGIAQGHFDFAISTNALHATKNIRVTLSNAKAALARHGLLLVNEVAGHTLYSHIAFGLLKGWWLYEDRDLRIQGSPALTSENWHRALGEEGFDPVLFPLAGSGLGSQIIVAQSDGVLRQRTMAQGHGAAADTVASGPSVSEGQPPRTSVSLSAEEKDRVTKRRVRRTIVETLSHALDLKTDAIDPDGAFADYGVDSITGVQLIRRINQSLSIGLETTALFDHSSVNKLTARILSAYPGIADIDSEEKSHSADAAIVEPRAASLSEPTAILEENRVLPPARKELIAVIGMSGRFPKSGTVHEFWEHLARGEELIEKVSRWDIEKRYARLPDATGYCRHGGFLDEIDRFDPLFFNISGQEATWMDPQQRIFLEEAWKTLEDAGYAGGVLQGSRCGVYAGCGPSDYVRLLGDNPPPQAYWGNAASILAARIAYYLDLQGPAIAVDTACSSSLVAIHLACQGLWNRETDFALAGGVFVLCTPEFYVTSSGAGMLSPSGHCYAFDERADGFVPGEGAGVLALKRLSDAIADGDHIYGVIRGSAINQDGATNGITAPSAVSQERLERDVYDTFGVNPEHIQFVEAHGTATKLGDPIEYAALTRAFRRSTDKKGYCAIGSVKTNMGHAATAAGAISVIKVLLALKHRKIPPSLNFRKGNEHIDFDNSPFYVNTQLRDWETSTGIRRTATVSGFGFSGTNAHLVIEEAVASVRTPRRRAGYLIVLSAHTEQQLRQQAGRLLAFAKDNPNVDWGNASFTLMVGRGHFDHRLACVVYDRDDLIDTLAKWLNRENAARVYAGHVDSDDVRDQPSMRRHGEQCLADCNAANDAAQYLRHLSALAELYVRGIRLDYGRLFLAGEHSRISLPTYPFERESYWVAQTDRGNASDNTVPVPVPQTANEVFLLSPRWKPRAPVPHALPEGAVRQVLLVNLKEVVEPTLYKEYAGELDRALGPAGWSSLDDEGGDPAARFHDVAYRLFGKLRDLGRDKPKSKIFLQLLIPERHEPSLLMGFGSLLKVVAGENPKIIPQLIAFDVSTGPARLIEMLRESLNTGEQVLRYAGTERLCETLDEISAPSIVTAPWKDDGVYLITGGLGGLGLIFANAIAARANRATLVLTSRRAKPSDDMQSAFQALNARGARIDCQAVDVSDAGAVEELVGHIIERYGKLNGVLHGAGLLRNSVMLKKTREEFDAVFAPKVRGTLNLDEATKTLNLDHFILFSSLSAIFGNVGQADYAPANAFLDEYARYRNRLVAEGKRRGHTLSVNWPLWAEGGMRPNILTETKVRASGMIALPSEAGVQALYQALALGESQVAVLAGKKRDVQAALLHPTVASSDQASHVIAHDVTTAGSLVEKTIQYLRKFLASILKLSPERLQPDAPIEKYGVDSILMMQLTGELEKIFGSLSKTLFFEHQTLGALATYFADEHRNTLLKILGVDDNAAAGTAPTPTAAVHVSPPPVARELPATTFDIAVIGISGRYPSAENVEQLWENLKAGKDCISEVPLERWDHARYFDPDKDAPGKAYGKWGGFLNNADKFDSLFFNISPREAQRLDPQERLLLQTVWELCESAGYTREHFRDHHRGRVGVYVGATYQQYRAPRGDVVSDSYAAIASQGSFANRVSYFFGFEGPSIAVDTMCSSGAVAIHLACKDLLQGECEVAVAGAVNLSVHPHKFIGLSQARGLGSHPNCRSFGQGDGYLPSEGVGAVLLKPLAKAIEDNDTVLAVIKSSAVCHSGHSNGYSVPSLGAQARVIEQTLRRANVDPRTVSYVEAAANGSALGDPIEVDALGRAFRLFTNDRQFCAIGSVKSNLGHPEAASGMAQLAKVILQLRHRTLVPSIKAEPLNPNLRFDTTPFYLQRELADWKRPFVVGDGRAQELPRRALLNSFGGGGTYATLLIEEYMAAPFAMPVANRGPELIVLSAKNEERLGALVRNLLSHIDKHPNISLIDLAYTLQLGREAMESRLAVIATDVSALKEALIAYLAANDKRALCTTRPIFVGDTDTTPEEVRKLLFGQAEESFVRVLLAERDLERLAMYWTQGGRIPWRELHGSVLRQKISLPTYPFALQRYWMEMAEVPDTVAAAVRETPVPVVAASAAPHVQVESFVVQFLSQALALDAGAINRNRSLQDYGVDSIVGLRLLRGIETRFNVVLEGSELFGSRNIAALIAHVCARVGEQPVLVEVSPVMEPPAVEEAANVPITNVGANDDEIVRALKKFKQGELNLAQMEALVDKV